VTWLPTGSRARYARILSLTVDPSARETIYAGTRGNGILKSVDGGKTWSALSKELAHTAASILAIEPSAHSTIYADLNGGTFKSTDGGKEWRSIGPKGRVVTALVVDPRVPSTLYAGTPSGVYKSKDKGATWSDKSNGLRSSRINALLIDPRNPSTLYAGTDENGVFVSANGGRTWARLGAGLINPCVQTLAIDPADPTRLAAGTNGDGVFTTTIAHPPVPPVLISVRAAQRPSRLILKGTGFRHGACLEMGPMLHFDAEVKSSTEMIVTHWKDMERYLSRMKQAQIRVRNPDGLASQPVWFPRDASIKSE